MSIQNQDTSTSFTSDGSTTVYSFSFKVFEESDLRLVVVDDLDGESELELETDYTVSLNEGEGGSVTLNTALTLGYELYIFRNTAIENDLEITQNYVNLKQLENKLDMLTVISQEQNEFNNRSIKLNEKSNLSNIELKEPVFGKYLKFDVDRNITNSDVSFTELIDTPDIVNSIESLTGAVTKADLNIDQVTNTSDTQKVASGPIKVALDLKANTADVYTTGATDVLLDAKEDSLGNPSTSGQVLSSTNAGVRTWVTTSGAAPVDSVNSQTGVVSLGLDDLDNVNINTSTITDGQVVAWDNPTSMFVAATPSAGGAVDSVNGEIGVVVLDKTDIGLTNVDNTSDADKPVSTAQQTALDLKLNITDQYNTTVITGNYTLLDTDRVLVVNTTSDITITLGGTGLDLGRSIRVYSDVASHGILTFERGSGGDVVIAAGNLSKLPETIGMDTEFLEFQAFNGVGGNYWTVLSNVPADGTVSLVKLASDTATKWQRKDLSSSVSVGGVLSDITFNNLISGKTYKISGNIRIETSNDGDGDVDVRNTDNSIIVSNVGQLNGVSATGFKAFPSSFDAIFIAASNGSLTFLFAETGTNQVFSDGTYAILEELPNHVEVTDFT